MRALWQFQVGLATLIAAVGVPVVLGAPIASSSSARGSERNGQILYATPSGLAVAGPTGGSGRLIPSLANAREAVFSPRGTRLAFVSSTGEEAAPETLFLARSDGRGVRQLTTLPPLSDRFPSSGDFSPTWYPTGRFILFQREIIDEANSSEFVDLFVVSDLGGRPTRLTRSPLLWEHSPDVSPDGKTVVFTFSDQRGNATIGSGLFLLGTDGKGLRRLTRTPGFNSDETPTWSPDGRRIAFTRERDAAEGDPSFRELHVINADGSGMRALTRGARAYGPVWSPDGRFLAYCTFPGGPSAPAASFLAPAAGGPSRPLPLAPPGCVEDWRAATRG